MLSNLSLSFLNKSKPNARARLVVIRRDTNERIDLGWSDALIPWRIWLYRARVWRERVSGARTV